MQGDAVHHRPATMERKNRSCTYLGRHTQMGWLPKSQQPDGQIAITYVHKYPNLADGRENNCTVLIVWFGRSRCSSCCTYGWLVPVQRASRVQQADYCLLLPSLNPASAIFFLFSFFLSLPGSPQHRDRSHFGCSRQVDKPSQSNLGSSRLRQQQ
jgi:hypothetical protein